jgi:hypothetical protein
MAEKLSAAQQKAVDWIQGHKAVELGEIGTEIGKMLAELAVDAADAKVEAAHWKRSFETMKAEFRVAVGVAMRKLSVTKLVITRTELGQVPEDTELYVGTPEPGVRIYELRPRRAAVGDAVKNALNGRVVLPH